MINELPNYIYQRIKKISIFWLASILLLNLLSYMACWMLFLTFTCPQDHVSFYGIYVLYEIEKTSVLDKGHLQILCSLFDVSFGSLELFSTNLTLSTIKSFWTQINRKIMLVISCHLQINKMFDLAKKKGMFSQKRQLQKRWHIPDGALCCNILWLNPTSDYCYKELCGRSDRVPAFPKS